jgi:asparagine synthase (glutamine-hydrolysing)
MRTASTRDEQARPVSEFVGFQWSENDHWPESSNAGQFSPIWTGPPVTLLARGELRTFTNRVGRLAVAGHCLATDRKVNETLATGDLSMMSRLPGAYAFVYVSSTSGLALAVDAAGQFPIYVGERTGQVVFGSQASLVAMLTGADVDTVALAADIVSFPSSRTAFHGVSRVDSGTVLKVDKNGLRTARIVRLHSDERTTLDDAAERLRVSLLEAIDARVATAAIMSADFSGGLDSTSLAFIAEARLRVLPVLTFHAGFAPVPDDADRARRYARLRSGFEHVWIAGTARQLPYQSLSAAADVPHWAPLTMEPLRLRLRAAAVRGSRLHLVGEAGDILLNSPHVYLADLARRGELPKLWRHCMAWGRLRGRSPAVLFRRALLLAARSRRAALRELARALIPSGRSTRYPSWEDHALTRWGSPPCDFLSRSARVVLAEHLLATADLTGSDNQGWGDEVTIDQLRSMAGTLQAVRAEATNTGVSVHAPFLDTAVVEACLSVPAHRRCDPVVPKPLLRKALTGLVPSEVLSRRTKGDYTQLAHLGARRAARRLRALLRAPASADYGVIDPRPVRQALESGLQGDIAPWGDLNKVFALELWLRARDSRPADD